MKKFLLFFGAIAMMTVSCKDKETETVETTETETVIVAPQPTENDMPPPPPPAPVEEEADGTSIKVGSDGVTLDTKDGTKKTTVDVREGGAVLEVKK